MQARERGALFVNASYTPATGEPALDWLSYHDVVGTRDKLIQESIGFYDPARQVIVFTLLPSASGNSVAMWRRKVSVPTNLRLAWAREIELAKAALMKDYLVYVDELEWVSPVVSGRSLVDLILQISYRRAGLVSCPCQKEEGFFQKVVQIVQGTMVVSAFAGHVWAACIPCVFFVCHLVIMLSPLLSVFTNCS